MRPSLLLLLTVPAALLATPVRDEQAAVDLAMPALVARFGQDRIVQFQPYHALNKGNVWIVRGTLPNPRAGGGVPEARVSSADGRVLEVYLGR